MSRADGAVPVADPAPYALGAGVFYERDFDRHLDSSGSPFWFSFLIEISSSSYWILAFGHPNHDSSLVYMFLPESLILRWVRITRGPRPNQWICLGARLTIPICVTY